MKRSGRNRIIHAADCRCTACYFRGPATRLDIVMILAALATGAIAAILLLLLIGYS